MRMRTKLFGGIRQDRDLKTNTRTADATFTIRCLSMRFLIAAYGKLSHGSLGFEGIGAQNARVCPTEPFLPLDKCSAFCSIYVIISTARAAALIDFSLPSFVLLTKRGLEIAGARAPTKETETVGACLR